MKFCNCEPTDVAVRVDADRNCIVCGGNPLGRSTVSFLLGLAPTPLTFEEGVRNWAAGVETALEIAIEAQLNPYAKNRHALLLQANAALAQVKGTLNG